MTGREAAPTATSALQKDPSKGLSTPAAAAFSPAQRGALPTKPPNQNQPAPTCSELRSATLMLVAKSRAMTEQSLPSREVSCAVSWPSKKDTSCCIRVPNSRCLRRERRAGGQAYVM